MIDGLGNFVNAVPCPRSHDPAVRQGSPDRYRPNDKLEILSIRNWPNSRLDLAFRRTARGSEKHRRLLAQKSIDGPVARDSRLSFDFDSEQTPSWTKDRTMLVLSRKKDEKIIIGDNVSIMIVDIQGDKVRLGIEAPREVSVHREEVYQAIQKKQTEPVPANS